MNYYDQLCQMYPDKKELLWLMQYPLHHQIYAYGNHSNISMENISKKNDVKTILHFFYVKYLKKRQRGKRGLVVSSVDGLINKYLSNDGFEVMALEQCVSIKTFIFLKRLLTLNFNEFLKSNFEKKLIRVKEELRLFFSENDVRFLLLINDVLPLPRLAISVCRELNIQTGVFLHGLPASYDLIDNFQVNYTFVWGESIKNNYLKLGCKNRIVVSGNPKYSGKEKLQGNHNEVVVISFCAGDVYDGAENLLADRGLCVQYAYTVQSVLLELGVNHAVLRVHPHEKAEWYEKFVDANFYRLDKKSLMETLSNASYLVGPFSSVLIDAVSRQVPYYPYIIVKEVNSHSWLESPPFRKEDGLPVARSTDELKYNITNGQYVMERHICSYYAHSFDLSSILDCFIRKKRRK